MNSRAADGFSDIYAQHGISSAGQPTIGVTDNLAVAEYFARGLGQNQAGFVTAFRVPLAEVDNVAFRNFENPMSFFEIDPRIGLPESEYLFHTRIDPKYFWQQTRVAPR